MVCTWDWAVIVIIGSGNGITWTDGHLLIIVPIEIHFSEILIKLYTTVKCLIQGAPNLNVSRLGLQLSLCNVLKPSVKWRMKM